MDRNKKRKKERRKGREAEGQEDVWDSASSGSQRRTNLFRMRFDAFDNNDKRSSRKRRLYIYMYPASKRKRRALE